MSMPIFCRPSSLLRLLRRLLGMSVSNNADEGLRINDVLPPYHQQPIVLWAEHIVQIVTDSSMETGNRHRELINSIKIVNIARYKQRNRPFQHEYLIVRVRRGEDTRSLLIQRSGRNAHDLSNESMTPLPTPGDDVNQEVRAVVEASTNSSGLISRAFMSSAGHYDAVDTVSLASPGQQDVRLQTLTISPQCNMTLLHIALIAKATHDKAVYYRVFHAQCYWFADTILRVLHRAFSQAVNATGQQTDASEHIVYEEVPGSEAAGTILGIPIQRTRAEVVQIVLDSYIESKQTVEARMHAAIHSITAAQQQVQDALQREADAQRQMEEERRLREEEQRLREEERRLKEEALKKSDELQRQLDIAAEKMKALELAVASGSR